MTVITNNGCIITNKTNNSSISPPKVVYSEDAEMLDPNYGFFAHLAFGIIVVLSFVGNVLICVVILRRKSLLRKPCNILILNLAATDLLTGEKQNYPKISESFLSIFILYHFLKNRFKI